MDWIEISVQADGEAAEAVSELFNRLNSRPDGQGGAVTEVGGFDPVGEEHHPTVTVRTYLPAGAGDTPERRQRIEKGLWFLGRIYAMPEPQVRVLAEDDWANAWKAHYKPLRVGRRFVVVPAWLWPGGRAVEEWRSEGVEDGSQGNEGNGGNEGNTIDRGDLGLIREGDLALVLDPGMAFGTGLHPSTQLCLRAMEDAVRVGDRVLDAGCGSGILSIAAARLGAGEVHAFDLDPVAVTATEQNAALNHLPNPIHVFESAGPDGSAFWAPLGRLRPQFDVILVNILAHVIISLLERDLAHFLAPGGRMVLAGVIADQEPQLRMALAEHNLTVVRQLEQGDWVSFVVEAKE